MYLEFQEYIEMGGTLDSTAFTSLELKASKLVAKRTFNRLKYFIEIPTEVKECVFELIKILDDKSKAFTLGQDLNGETNASIASQSNDGVSITYNTMSASDVYQISSQSINETISLYLDDVRDLNGRRILYRGYY